MDDGRRDACCVWRDGTGVRDRSGGMTGGFSGSAWCADLARYEASGLAVRALGIRLKVALFRYPVGRIAGRVASSESLEPSPYPRRTIVVWLRYPRNGRLRHFLWPR